MKFVTIFVMLATLIAIGVVASVSAQSSACQETGALPEGASAMLIADCEALMASKSPLKGTGSLNWWSGRPINNWNGVTVEGGRVTVLDLRNMSLDGTIPERLTDLDALVELYLVGNAFTGCIPSGLRDVATNDLDDIANAYCDAEEPEATPMPTATVVPIITPTPSPTPTTGTNVEERLDAIDDDIADLTDWLEGIDEDLDAIDDDLVDIFDRLGTLEASPPPISPPGEVLLPSDSPPLGSTVLAGDSTYRVNELIDPASWSIIAPDEGNRYVAADITQMATEEGDDYNFLDFSAQDSEGYVYDGTIWADAGVHFGVGELGPSETTRGWVTFEVLESAVIISIRVEYDYSEPVAIIAVTGLENLPAPTPVPVVSSVSDLTVADENRCAPYDSGDYSYSRTLEAKIVEEMGGIIYGPYTGTTFASTSETDIEHIVARSEAHDSGLCAVDVTKRKEFAGDLLNLTLASPSVNRHQKGAKDVAEWLPALNECWFADRVVKVRKKYELTTDQAEVDALTAVLSDCDSTDMIVITPTPAP